VSALVNIQLAIAR